MPEVYRREAAATTPMTAVIRRDRACASPFMGRSRGRTAMPVLLAAVVALGLGGCGASGAAPSPIATPIAVPSPARPVPTVAATARPGGAPPTQSGDAPPTLPGEATRTAVGRLQAAVRAAPDDPEAQLALGQALLQLERETLDASLYAPARQALEAADRLQPDDARTLAALGALHAGQHDFADALALGRRAVERSPGLTAAHAVVVDSLVELGRYAEAEAAAGRMLAAGDDLGTLARISYLRELHGELEAARTLMADAAERPGAVPENRAFALSVLANLERWTGDPDAARATWTEALSLVPDHPPSLAGLARLAVGAGDLQAAERLFRRAAAVVPLPEYVIALAEVQAARGDVEAAARSEALAAAEIRLFADGGVAVDQELALFEADHGDPARALELARAAYRATPTIRAADAVAWALHRLGRDDRAMRWMQRALALGTRDPLLRFHAGAIEAAAGHARDARRDLRMALDTDPGFSALGAAEARSLLEGLGD
jgi:tetratricopeptide (TPR) repeat protein